MGDVLVTITADGHGDKGSLRWSLSLPVPELAEGPNSTAGFCKRRRLPVEKMI